MTTILPKGNYILHLQKDIKYNLRKSCSSYVVVSRGFSFMETPLGNTMCHTKKTNRAIIRQVETIGGNFRNIEFRKGIYRKILRRS